MVTYFPDELVLIGLAFFQFTAGQLLAFLTRFITTSEINRTFFDNWGVIIYIYLDFSLLLCWIRLSFLSIPQLSHKPWA